MKSNDVRPFIPVKDFEQSTIFYKALGFNCDDINDSMVVVSNGVCTFFLYKDERDIAGSKLMFQLSVPNIDDALSAIQHVNGLNVTYDPIKIERWGKVICMWGPSGEMWQITELQKK